MANSYDLTEDDRNSLLDYQNALQNGLGVSNYDHDTMIDTLVALRNSSWAKKQYVLEDHINKILKSWWRVIK